MFEALSRRKGWGPKTAALFIRNLAVIAASPELADRFWPDIHMVNDEPIRLPVDAVIKAIFQHLRVSGNTATLRPNDFDNINKYLLVTLQCTPAEMLIWDDLWFWGFITQRSEAGKTDRNHEWNEAKYWSIFATPKTKESIAAIERLATGKAIPKATGRSDDGALAANFLSLIGARESPAK